MNIRVYNAMKEGGMGLSKVIDMIDEETKIQIYRFTKMLIEENKELSIKEIMKHDSYKKVKGRIRQVGWANIDI